MKRIVLILSLILALSVVSIIVTPGTGKHGSYCGAAGVDITVNNTATQDIEQLDINSCHTDKPIKMGTSYNCTEFGAIYGIRYKVGDTSKLNKELVDKINAKSDFCYKSLIFPSYIYDDVGACGIFYIQYPLETVMQESLSTGYITINISDAGPEVTKYQVGNDSCSKAIIAVGKVMEFIYSIFGVTMFVLSGKGIGF